jgi:hypothetical protein
MLPLAHALPADTAIPARSSRISCAADDTPGNRYATDQRDCRRLAPSVDHLSRTERRTASSSRPQRAMIRLRLAPARRHSPAPPANSRSLHDSPFPAPRWDQHSQITHQQRADTRRPAALVRRQCNIDRQACRPDRPVECRHLRRIDQQQCPRRMPRRLGNRRQRLAHPRLAVRPLHADQRRPCRHHRLSAQRSRSTSPSLPTGTTPASPPALSAASCSTADQSPRRSRSAQRDTERLARPAGQDRLPRQPWAAAITRRASSSAARAARPSRCGDEGLAHRSNPFATAARAAAVIGVVAA